MIDAGLTAKNIEWTQKILQDYTHLIHPDARSETKLMSEAQLSFSRGNYKRAIDQFNELEMTTKAHMIRSKWMTIMCQYEMRDKESLDHSLNSFSSYVRSNETKISETKYLALNNFIRFVRMLRTGKRIQQLEREFSSVKHIVKGSWIKEKIEELASNGHVEAN